MRCFFTAIAAALLLTALSGVALAWDGSYFLFSTLDLQSPFLVYGRLAHIPLDWLVLQASHLNASPMATQTAFGLVYFSLTLGALSASWWIVRDHAPTLFVWSALAIGLGTLPGQVCAVCQAAVY